MDQPPAKPPFKINDRSVVFDSKEHRAQQSSVACSCGQTNLAVNWIEAPDTGGYCKVTCPDCGNSQVLIDDSA